MNFKLYFLPLLFTLTVCDAIEDFYKFTVENHEGENVSLNKYKGKVTLVVNVASQCGFTDSTYRALKKLQDILGYEDHFSVLAFPCNQFGDQEPGEISEIISAITTEYDVEFPIFNKINVTGEHASPAFKNLIEQSSMVPEWNFYKYLVGKDGVVISSWGTRTTIEDIFEVIQSAIEDVKDASVSDVHQPIDIDVAPVTSKHSEHTSQQDASMKDEL